MCHRDPRQPRATERGESKGERCTSMIRRRRASTTAGVAGKAEAMFKVSMIPCQKKRTRGKKRVNDATRRSKQEKTRRTSTNERDSPFLPFEILLSSAGMAADATIVAGAVFSLVDVASAVSGIMAVENEESGGRDTAADAM
jgi:hypothetical protein